MKKILTLALVAGLAPLAFAADGNTASATAQASVTILAPVTVTTSGSLQFGKVVVSATPTTIKIDAAAKVSTDANSTVYVQHGATSVPTFSITKDTTASVNLAIVPTFNGATFTVDPAVVSAANAFAVSNLASYLNQPLYGALEFAAGTTPHGVVTGSISITANYI